MKTIGLIGGMSWESTAEYYRIINETVKEKLGGFHSAKMIMYSVDFSEVEEMQNLGQWDDAARLLIEAARKIEKAGAEFGLICANTMHKVFDKVQKSIAIPLLHIADVTAQEIQKCGIYKVGLLGTRYTMEQDFYKDRLQNKYCLKVIIPAQRERAVIHRILYNELCLGKIKKTSRDRFKKIIAGLVARGAKGIILGCTEIPLLVDKRDYKNSIFDTTELHARAAVEYALQPY
jgi:aspartate racemase